MQYLLLTNLENTVSLNVSKATALSPHKVQHPLCEDVTYVMDAFLSVSEQILHNIKQEYKRLQKRRHLDSAFQQETSGCPLDLQNAHSGSALPGSYRLSEDIFTNPLT